MLMGQECPRSPLPGILLRAWQQQCWGLEPAVHRGLLLRGRDLLPGSLLLAWQQQSWDQEPAVHPEVVVYPRVRQLAGHRSSQPGSPLQAWQWKYLDQAAEAYLEQALCGGLGGHRNLLPGIHLQASQQPYWAQVLPVRQGLSVCLQLLVVCQGLRGLRDHQCGSPLSV